MLTKALNAKILYFSIQVNHKGTLIDERHIIDMKGIYPGMSRFRICVWDDRIFHIQLVN